MIREWNTIIKERISLKDNKNAAIYVNVNCRKVTIIAKFIEYKGGNINMQNNKNNNLFKYIG